MSIRGQSLCYLSAILLFASLSQAKEPKQKENIEVTVEVKFVEIDKKVIDELKQQGLLGDENKNKDVPLLDNAQMIRFIHAVQSEVHSSVMQVPRLTTLNGQHGALNILETKNFVTGRNFVSREGRLVAETKNEIIPLGIQVDVQPIVSADRRSVRLHLNLKWNSLASCEDGNFALPIPAPIQVKDANNQVRTVAYFVQEQPQINKLSLSRSLVIPDQSTAVLQGLTNFKCMRAIEERIPILGDLPYIGRRLFRTVGYECQPHHLLVLVTPYIHVKAEGKEKR